MSHAEEHYMYGKDMLGKGLDPNKSLTTQEHKKPTPQVGGDHYAGKIEPIEFIEANDIPFHEANVIKYVFRHKKKNGIEDLLKSHWYVLRLIELEYHKLSEKDKDDFKKNNPKILQFL